MSKSSGTSLKDAIKQFEQAKGCVAADAEKVELWGRVPPIEKLDATLSTLKSCKHLALSTNNINKISNLAGLDKLEVLSLARNVLTRIEGLDPVCATLQELWLSYNQIIKLSGLEACTSLRVLYLANNLIREFKELEAVPGCVEDISLVGNPVWEAAKLDGGMPSSIGSTYRIEILRRLPHLKKIDGVTVDMDERDAAAKKGLGQTVVMGATMGHTTRSAGSADGGQERGGEVAAAAPAAPDVAAT